MLIAPWSKKWSPDFSCICLLYIRNALKRHAKLFANNQVPCVAGATDNRGRGGTGGYGHARSKKGGRGKGSERFLCAPRSALLHAHALIRPFPPLYSNRHAG